MECRVIHRMLGMAINRLEIRRVEVLPQGLSVRMMIQLREV